MGAIGFKYVALFIKRVFLHRTMFNRETIDLSDGLYREAYDSVVSWNSCAIPRLQSSRVFVPIYRHSPALVAKNVWPHFTSWNQILMNPHENKRFIRDILLGPHGLREKPPH